MRSKIEQLSGLAVKENALLAELTTFKIGGPAKYLVEACEKNQLLSALMAAKSLSLPYFILGGGSNVLVSDRGFDGLVIHLAGGELRFGGSKVSVFAGYWLENLVSEALARGLGGLEFCANIPGTVGGAVRGNAGAYGQGVGDFVDSVEVIDLSGDTPQVKNFPKVDCEFGYRFSIFKKNSGLIVAEATFNLSPVNDADASRRKIKTESDARCAKQPLDLPSAGCTFQNVVFAPEYVRMESFVVQGKIPAGRLIEECDLKGMKIGRAMVSDKHANFIVNLGGAKAEDVAQLISLVKTRVRNEFGVQLREEIEYVGF